MATYALRRPALSLPKFFQRVVNGFALIADVYAEAQEMQRAAHRRYPFLLDY